MWRAAFILFWALKGKWFFDVFGFACKTSAFLRETLQTLPKSFMFSHKFSWTNTKLVMEIIIILWADAKFPWRMRFMRKFCELKQSFLGIVKRFFAKSFARERKGLGSKLKFFRGTKNIRERTQKPRQTLFPSINPWKWKHKHIKSIRKGNLPLSRDIGEKLPLYTTDAQ